jgi:mycothiol S-conjugate amidase
MCHRVSVAAYEAAGDPSRYPEAGPAWQPLKLYYDRGYSKPKVLAFHEALIAAGKESPFAEWLEHWDDEPMVGTEPKITTRVPCSAYFEVRDQALLAHATQIDPQGWWWFGIPLDEQARIWPTEDFELARTEIAVNLPEDDLFAGVREHLAAAEAEEIR